jgi:hypothetical protein
MNLDVIMCIFSIRSITRRDSASRPSFSSKGLSFSLNFANRFCRVLQNRSITSIFQLSEEHTMLRETCRSFANTELVSSASPEI